MQMKNFLVEPRLLALFDQTLVSGGNFLSLLYLGRRLAAADFGLFSLAMMSLLLFANLHRALFTQPLNILGAAEQAPQLAERMAALLRAQLLAIPVTIALLALLSVYFFPQAALLFGCACYIAGFFLQEMSRRYWYTVGQLERALRSDLISYGGQLLALLLAGAAGMLDAIGGAGALILMGAASALAFLRDLRDLPLPRGRGAQPVAGLFAQQWKLARWLVPTVLAVWGASQIFPFLIAALGPVAVASFVACRNLLNVTGIVVQSVATDLPIRAAALLRQQGRAAFRAHLVRTLARTALAGLLFVLLMLLSSDIVLHLAYGGTYDNAGVTMRILALAAFFSLLGAVLGAYSLAMEDSRASFLANLGASAVTLTLGLWLIHSSGVNGAAIAATLSAATAMALQGALVLARFKRLPHGDDSAARRRLPALLLPVRGKR
jgi:O-antigen/teichoic acid export membrane protein